MYLEFDSKENPYVYVLRLAMNLDVCIPTTPTHVICNKKNDRCVQHHQVGDPSWSHVFVICKDVNWENVEECFFLKRIPCDTAVVK